MSEARQCDACGKLYSLEEDPTRPKHPVLESRVFKIATFDKYNRKLAEIDLCSDCMNRVFDVWRKVDYKHGNDDEVRGEEARD